MKLATAATVRPSRRSAAGSMLLACALALAAAGVVRAQPGATAARPPAQARAEEGIRWHELKPAQRTALKPLEHEWPSIDAARKKKWLEISARYQKMSPEEQARLQERMSAWTRMTPQERGAARLRFQEAKQVPAQDRQARWNAYQALSPEKRRELAERASPFVSGAVARRNGNGRDVPQTKSNIVPNPAFAAQPKPVAPTVVRAGPGATTTLITRRPAPPSHLQTGLPKIAATPGFVDKATLLPQRGPQAAATRSASAASAADPARHQ